jgi:signal transduction histidine kinase/putative methionine-R-sulfoxide reductase with GAF domain
VPRELSALEAAGRLAAECTDLDDVVGMALESVTEITGLEIACVSLYNQETTTLETLAYESSKAYLPRSPSSQGLMGDLAGQVARTGEVVVVEDTWADPMFSAQTSSRPELRTYVGVPLKSTGNVMGVMSAASAQPFRFSSAHLAFLSVLGGQLSRAIESCVLRERLHSSRFRLRERVKELSILYDISREALSAGDLRDFLTFVAQRLPASMQYQDALAVVFCSAGGREHLTWSANLDEAGAQRLCLVPEGGPPGKLSCADGALLEEGISKLTGYAEDTEVASVLAVPIVVGGEPAGSIAVYYTGDSWLFLEEEKHLLRGISEQVAQYVARDAVELENQRHVQEVTTLFEVSKALASIVSIEGILPAIQSILMETLRPAEAGVLLLFDEATGMLRVASSFGYDVDALHGMSLRMGESMSGKVLESGRPKVWGTPDEAALAMANMTEYNRELFRLASRGLDFPKSAVGVPLIYREQKTGVLTLETFASDERFSPSHVPFLQAFAELMIISINQIRLMHEAEETRAVQEAERLRSELIAALAHDMRTPLTSIQGYASALLLEEIQWDEAAKTEQLEIIEAEAEALQTMIQDLLESSIIDAGLLTLAEEPTLIPRLVERLASEMSRRTAKHRFVISFPTGFPIVRADPRRIEQVLRNLLDNAIKYSPDGGLVVVRGRVAAGEVVVSVADNGIGIAPEHLNRLFEKFFRVKSPIGDKVRGTGLGLPVSRTIVESHGGRIWAESELGKGTTISFSLPCGESPEANEKN